MNNELKIPRKTYSKPFYVSHSGKVCDYGCGQIAHYQFKNGDWCCSYHHVKCPILIDKNKKGQKNRSKLIYIENSGHVCKWCREEGHYQFKNGDWCCEDHNTKCLVERKKIAEKSKGRIILKPKYIENSGHVCKWCREEGHYQFKNGDWCCKDHSNKCLIHRKKMKTTKNTLKDYQEKYPLFCKVEELREDPKTGEIQAHCKNHNCPNSKEMSGWFTPTKNQIMNRCSEIEYENRAGGCYFYCSEHCKHTCELYKKTADQIMKQDLINAGHIGEDESSILGYEIWRDEVFKRNKELLGSTQCELCGEIENMIAHHIYPRKSHPEQSLDPDNGLIVCSGCHLKKCHPKGTPCSYGELAKLVCEKRYNQNIFNIGKERIINE